MEIDVPELYSYCDATTPKTRLITASVIFGNSTSLVVTDLQKLKDDFGIELI